MSFGKPLTFIVCAASLVAVSLGMRQYLLSRDIERDAGRNSAELIPYPKPRPLPNPEIVLMNGPLPLADPSSTSARLDPEHPLKVGQEFYPAASRKAREEGRCVVQMTVMPDGRINNASVEAGSGSPSLDQACLNAVRGGHMLPATEDGKPIEKTIRLALDWKLPG